MSFVESCAYAAPVCSVASPEPFSRGLERRCTALASASRNVNAFLGLGNALSNAACAMLTSYRSCFAAGGS